MNRRGNNQESLDRLRARLMAGDPAVGGADLSPEASAKIRRAMLEAIPSSGVTDRRAPLIAAAVLIVCGALVGYQLWIRHGGSTPVPNARAAGHDGAPFPPHAVRIDFTTESGTRILWIVDPEFRLD